MKSNKILISIAGLGVVFTAFCTVGCGSNPEPTPPTLSSISVTAPPTKTEYFAGETFDYQGMEVTGTYSDNSIKIIPFDAGEDEGYSIDKLDELVSTDTVVTVSYKDKTATTPIQVTDSLGIIREAKTLNFDAVNEAIKNFSTYQPDSTGKWKEEYQDTTGTVKGECIGHLLKGSIISMPFVVMKPATLNVKMKLAKYDVIDAGAALKVQIDGTDVTTNTCTLGRKTPETCDADRFWNWKEWNVNSDGIELFKGVHTLTFTGIHDAGVPSILSYQLAFTLD